MSNKVALIEHSLCLQHISQLPVKYTNTTCSFSRTYQLIAIHVTLFGYYKQTTPINSSEKRVHDLYLGKDSCKKECFLSGIARITSLPPLPPIWATFLDVKNNVLARITEPSNDDYDNDVSDNCDHNFGTFDDFGVKNDQKVSHNMILMSKYKGQHGGKTGSKNSGRGLPPPPFSGNAQKKTFFFFRRASLNEKLIM